MMPGGGHNTPSVGRSGVVGLRPRDLVFTVGRIGFATATVVAMTYQFAVLNTTFPPGPGVFGRTVSVLPVLP